MEARSARWGVASVAIAIALYVTQQMEVDIDGPPLVALGALAVGLALHAVGAFGWSASRLGRWTRRLLGVAHVPPVADMCARVADELDTLLASCETRSSDRPGAGWRNRWRARRANRRAILRYDRRLRGVVLPAYDAVVASGIAAPVARRIVDAPRDVRDIERVRDGFRELSGSAR